MNINNSECKKKMIDGQVYTRIGGRHKAYYNPTSNRFMVQIPGGHVTEITGSWIFDDWEEYTEPDPLDGKWGFVSCELTTLEEFMERVNSDKVHYPLFRISIRDGEICTNNGAAWKYFYPLEDVARELNKEG